MFNKLDDKTICLIIIMIFHTIFVCNSVKHSFCNDLNQISNIYSVGTHVFIAQGMTTIWMFDTITVQLSPVKQTLNSIFGEDHFEGVDSVFSFDLNSCRGIPKTCNNVEMARNVVVVIGEKINSADISKKYGYIAYRLRSDNTLEEMNKNWAHNWGLTADDTFSGSFWPSFRRNGSLIIGSAYSKNEKTLYLLVNEIDNNKKSLYRIYDREINLSGDWGEWTAFASVKQKGMFAIRGNVFVGDSEDNIISYRTEKNGLIDKKKISSAKEFFNCFKNSTLLKFKDLAEQRVNDFSEYRLYPDLNPYLNYNETNGTLPINETNEMNDTTTTSTTTTTTELSTVITTEGTEPPILNMTTNSPLSESTGQPISGWLVFLLILLIIVLIFVIVLIAILLNIRNKNKNKKAKPLPIAPAPAKSGSKPPKTSPKNAPIKTGSITAKPGHSPADLKTNSVRSSIA